MEWDIIEGRSDRVVGRVIRENGAYFLAEVEGETEVGAFCLLEQTVASAHTVFGGTDVTV